MSYEGYTQNLCENGHRFSSPDHLWFGNGTLCPFCNEKVCWNNSVDQTNFEDVGYISDEDWSRFLLTPEETQVCNLGHTHITKHATYLVPTEEQCRAFQTAIYDVEKGREYLNQTAESKALREFWKAS